MYKMLLLHRKNLIMEYLSELGQNGTEIQIYLLTHIFYVNNI